MFTLDAPDTAALPIAQRIVAKLRDAIVTMRIKPGEKLSEQDIADRFGVSRQPVREAFIKLAEAGLLRVLPQRGTLVVKISVAAVEDARFVREAIECAVAREAATRRTPADLVALAGILDDTAAAVDTAASDRIFDLDEAFHRRLAATAGRPHAWHVVVDQKVQMDRVRYLDLGDSIPARIVLAQHRDILAAITAGDAVAAEASMRDHLREILTSLPRLAARWPGLFEAEDATPGRTAPAVPA
jgi:DNA-binding GntR family transcriptional regulator